MDANELILNAMVKSSEPLKAGDIAEKTGIDKKDVDKVIKKLVAENKIYSPKRCFYSVKK